MAESLTIVSGKMHAIDSDMCKMHAIDSDMYPRHIVRPICKSNCSDKLTYHIIHLAKHVHPREHNHKINPCSDLVLTVT